MTLCPRCSGRLEATLDAGPGYMFCPGCREFVSEIGIGQAANSRQATNGHTPDVPGGLGPVVVTVADVEREEVDWLWQGRLARGRLTCLMGDPGSGKSWITGAIATAISKGEPLPGETGRTDPADALFLCAEDGLADTVRPRLEDMGADLTKVHVLTAVRGLDGKERHPSLVDNLGDLERALVERPCALLVIDPINAYLGSQLDTHRDAALRGAIAPVAALCERLGVACVFVLHLTKSGRDRALYRGQGSIAYTAAARVVLLAGQNPENPEERAVVWVKGNLTEPPPSIGYEISEGRFYWRGESDLTAGQLLAPDVDTGKQSALKEAEAFLFDTLADGPRPSREVEREAEGVGIATRTLRRARKQAGVRAVPIHLVGQEGIRGWTWTLPDKTETGLGGQEGQVENLAPLLEFVSESGPVAAEVGHLTPDAATNGRTCNRCPQPLSVVAVGDLCGRCKAKTVTAWKRLGDGRYWCSACMNAFVADGDPGQCPAGHTRDEAKAVTT